MIVKVADQLFENREEQFFLVAKVIVDNALTDACRIGDILHGYVAVALEGDAEESRLDYLGSSFRGDADLG
jgi:hypothetical protein